MLERKKRGPPKKPPRPRTKKRPRAPNYKRQAKQLLAMSYLLHNGNMSRAAKACGINQRTANSWREKDPELWDELLREARAQREGFIDAEEKDTVWTQLADMIDRVATMGAAISINELTLMHTKQKEGLKLTDKERDLAGRLFGIGTDKSMAVRGIGKMGAEAGVFDDFKDRIARKIAERLADDPHVAARVGEAIASDADGNGEAVDVKKLTTYTPKPPIHPN